MPSDPFAPPRLRNPRTHSIMRREMFWQIWLPLGLAAGLAIAALVWLILPQAFPTRSPLADVSLMWLILIAALQGLISLALLGGLIYGLYYLLRESPFWFSRAQEIMDVVAAQALSITAQIDAGILTARSFIAAAQSLALRMRALFVSWRDG